MGYVLITGASEGIGKELAYCAAKDGYDLILVARSEDKLNALAHELKALKEKDVVVIPSDLGVPGAAETLWDKATQGREIDVLINNAGIGINGPFAETDKTREEAMVQINVVALTQLMKSAAQYMVARNKGRILNVASVAGFMAGPRMAAYHATKAYVLSLSEAVAKEVKGTGVSVTVLCPGATRTEFFGPADMEDVRITKMSMMSAKDVASAGWIGMKTGQTVVIPGMLNNIFAQLPRIFPRNVAATVTNLFYERG